jgi:hypothetical protein
MVGALPGSERVRHSRALRPAGRLRPVNYLGFEFVRSACRSFGPRRRCVQRSRARTVPRAPPVARATGSHARAPSRHGLARSRTLHPGARSSKTPERTYPYLTSVRGARYHPSPFRCRGKQWICQAASRFVNQWLGRNSVRAGWRGTAKTNALVAFLSQLPDAGYDNGVKSLNGLAGGCRRSTTGVTRMQQLGPRGLRKRATTCRP